MGRHLNIGAGRIVWQDIVRIDVSIKKRQFHKSPNIVASMQRAKDGNGRFHLLGLVSCVFIFMLRASYVKSRIFSVELP
jgi:bisphosphoglycerate-independent phosphoglycerate mutase (AlkP superfamily)